MDKLRMQSSNGVEDNITKIAQLFPDCVTETVDERSGQPKHLIDFEKLKQNLSDSVMSERAERYQFTWPDKSKAILLANSPVNATLRPCREDSVDFDRLLPRRKCKSVRYVLMNIKRFGIVLSASNLNI